MAKKSKTHISDEQLERNLRHGAKDTLQLFTLPEGWRDRLFDRIYQTGYEKSRG